MEIIGVIVLCIIGYIFGSAAEKKHFASIKQRERELLSIAARPDATSIGEAQEAFLVQGSVCIAQDYFKAVAASLRNFFGGRVSAYETMLDRGRREAVLRMKEQAAARGAREIVNVRVETIAITNGTVEVLAYGTALRYG